MDGDMILSIPTDITDILHSLLDLEDIGVADMDTAMAADTADIMVVDTAMGATSVTGIKQDMAVVPIFQTTLLVVVAIIILPELE